MTIDKGIFIRTIYYMLTYAFQELKQNNYEEIAGEEFEEIHDLFAEILLRGISFQLKQGLHKEYISCHGSLSTLKGKLDICGTVNNLMRKQQKIDCEYDELSENNKFNQILKTTVQFLLKHPKVKSDRKAALKRLMLFFSSEVMETLMEEKPWETTGMVVLQAESEVSSINMVYGGASTGKRVMTSSSSPGVSLMSEGLSYLAGAELPCVVVNCQRGGPGLGTIQPSQGDYFQACKGGAHGDFHLIVLAPNSVQEMHDFVGLAFDLAFKYRNPAMILADGAIGQMMEKVVLAPQRPRKTDAEIAEECKDWATCGKGARKDRNIITSLELKSEVMEKINQRLQAKYKAMEENEVRYEAIDCDDADYVIVAFGSSARICSATVEMARAEGIKVGLLRPITLYPFPTKAIADLAKRGVKGFLSAELNAGQMVQDVKLAVNGAAPVEHYGRQGGMMFSPDEVLVALKEKLINKK